MTNFSGTELHASGTAQITIDFDLYGDVEAALARNGASLDDVVYRAFLELADIGNSFSIMYQNFEMEFETETLSFSLASLRYEPGGAIRFTISLVGGPKTVRHEDLSEEAQLALDELFGRTATKN
jgi:hypothetical protein